ncbi:MAG: exodeoxyribonuclease VII large subunit [Flavobacteriales bacterium]|nr:exodeoxyribonuclease VII large subunit [Flavobacteriales bacterium]
MAQVKEAMTYAPTFKYHTLEELSQSLKSIISKAYTSEYWIKAELYKLNYFPKSGHCYPELLEKRDEKIVARIDGMIWRDDYLKIDKSFINTTGENLKDGITILFKAGVEYHPINGLKLHIREIDPNFTLGELARQKNACIQKLKDEGLFDRNRNLPLPVLPKRLAIISVETSKGYRDVMDVLEGNEYKYVFITSLFPALLQGDTAIASILGQLQNIERRQSEFDLVLIIRGGGGDVGLSCFDDYKLASRIATFPIPIAAGIGHSTNLTVSEQVANKNFITPTEVGYFLIDAFRTLEEHILAISQDIFDYASRMLEQNIYKLARLSGRLQVSCIEKVHFHQTTVHKIIAKMKQATNQKMALQCIQINETIPRRIKLAESSLLKAVLKHLDMLNEKLQILSPEQTLKRGYSITTFNGKSLLNSEGTKEGDTIKTTLLSGQIISIITKTQPNESDK